MSGLLDFIYDSPTFVDLYEILEVEMDAKMDEIKTAYIKMAKKNHPDQGGSSDKFQEITRAYEILYSKETRKEYDLYYLKKSMGEFSGNDYDRLRNDFKKFADSTFKPITPEELDKLYAETFNEYRDKYIEAPLDVDETNNKMNDIMIERKNMQIETSDDTLSNFIKEHVDCVNVNEIFEYLKYKNANSFSNQVMIKELGTLDTMPGYSNGFSSFMDENEYFGSNLYSNIMDMNDLSSSNLNNNLNINEFNEWKTNRHVDKKLTDNDIDLYLKKRKEEQDNIFNEVHKNLESNIKVKEVEKFLKTKHLKENVDEYYNNLDLNKIPSKKHSNIPELIDLNGEQIEQKFNQYQNSDDIDGMLKFMDEINHTNHQDYGELEKEIGVDKLEENNKEDFIKFKSHIIPPKYNNVRKRDII